MEVYIIGCGGNSKVVIDICELCNYRIMGIFDDKYDDSNDWDSADTLVMAYKQYKIIGKICDIPNYFNINIINIINIINSVGNNTFREKVFKELSNSNLNWINCIHPNTYIAPTAKIGIGNIICYGAFINSDTVIGDFNLVNTYAIIEHDCVIGNFNHFAPRSTLCGGIIVQNVNLLGASSTVIPCKKIGNHNIIGAQTVIINDFCDDNLIVGVPGKVHNG